MPMIDLPPRSTVEMSTTACALNVRLEIRSDFDKVIAFLAAARGLFAEEAAPVGQTAEERDASLRLLAYEAVKATEPPDATVDDMAGVAAHLVAMAIPPDPIMKPLDPSQFERVARSLWEGTMEQPIIAGCLIDGQGQPVDEPEIAF